MLKHKLSLVLLCLIVIVAIQQAESSKAPQPEPEAEDDGDGGRGGDSDGDNGRYGRNRRNRKKKNRGRYRSDDDDDAKKGRKKGRRGRKDKGDDGDTKKGKKDKTNNRGKNDDKIDLGDPKGQGFDGKCDGDLYCWTCCPSDTDDKCFKEGYGHGWEKCNVHGSANDYVCELRYYNDNYGGKVDRVSRGCRQKKACWAESERNARNCKKCKSNVPCVECQTGEGAICCEERQWGDWSKWSKCKKKCGEEESTRTRKCGPKTCPFQKDCKGNAVQKRDCDYKCCAVDGGWTTWSYWSGCSVTCGKGTESRTRTCDDPAPSCYGKKCKGSGCETRECKKGCCKGYGRYGKWTQWCSCSASCGYGVITRNRYCKPDKHGCNGDNCQGDNKQTKKCGSAPDDGNWGKWNCWSKCSTTCGKGFRKRTRKCDYPTRSCGGKDCDGNDYETEECGCDNIEDGGWSDWGEWDKCSATCGPGTARRTRVCTNPSPSCGGADCDGVDYETEKCKDKCCKVDGGWTKWSDYDKCSVTCGGGYQSRTRTCTYPKPKCHGDDCDGDAKETIECNTQCCPRDGNWTDWTEWGKCSKTCDNGIQKRHRKCEKPTPYCGGAGCDGNSWDKKHCNESCCPKDGKWGEWGAYGECSVTCGTGIKRRERLCNDPEPFCNGRYCKETDDEKDYQTRTCKKQACEDECPYGNDLWCWKCHYADTEAECYDENNANNGWEQCTSYDDVCEYSYKVDNYGDPKDITRGCLDKVDCAKKMLDHNEQGCDYGTANSECHLCQYDICCHDGEWKTWGGWTKCTKPCGKEKRKRYRQCSYGDDDCPTDTYKPCHGDPEETEYCDLPCCKQGKWKPWTEWECRHPCGNTVEYRNRTCIDDPKAPEGSCDDEECDGPSSMETYCDNGCCPENGGYTKWQGWGKCSKSCGYGKQTNTRSCTNPTTSCGGKTCEEQGLGDPTKTRSCQVKPIVHGNWGKWGPFSKCSKTCAKGTKTRRRYCNDPTPSCGGDHCGDDNEDTQTCNDKCCPDVGKWGPWSPYECVAPCGKTIEFRNRTCSPSDHPPPRPCDPDCDGKASEQNECWHKCCPHYGTVGTWSKWQDGELGASCYRYKYRECQDDPDYEFKKKCPPICTEDLYEDECPKNSYYDCGVCVCRLLGDSIVAKYDGENLKLTRENQLLTLSEKLDGDCRFKVEVKVVVDNHGSVLRIKFVKITLDKGNVVIKLNDDYTVEFIKPYKDAEDASASDYWGDANDNVGIDRNGYHIVVQDKNCGTKIGFNPKAYGQETAVTVVVAKKYGVYLTETCGDC